MNTASRLEGLLNNSAYVELMRLIREEANSINGLDAKNYEELAEKRGFKEGLSHATTFLQLLIAKDKKDAEARQQL